MVLLLPAVVLFLFVSSQTGFSRHFRYVLPAFPFVLIWIGKVACAAQRKPRTIGVLVVGAMIWSAASSLWIYPHSMSYFNEAVGGPRRGGEHLLDSNIDWGQDLLYLKRWLDDHPDVTLDGLAYHGSYPATLAGIPETPYPPRARCLNANVPNRWQTGWARDPDGAP